MFLFTFHTISNFFRTGVFFACLSPSHYTCKSKFRNIFVNFFFLLLFTYIFFFCTHCNAVQSVVILSLLLVVFLLFHRPNLTFPFPLKDLDKTQTKTQLMRHHTSISELKKSFMESVPAPRPSEWDKRLSTNSPLRTVSINGQLQPAVSL